MKLEACPACKKRISVEATSCPKCGHPLEPGWVENKKAAKKERNKRLRKWWVVVISMWALYFWIEDDESSSKITVTKAEYGEVWGFKVDSLDVSCRNHNYEGGIVRPHVLVTANGTDYALNGAAMGSDLYPNARDIMIRDDNGALSATGPKEVLKRGLTLCGN